MKYLFLTLFFFLAPTSVYAFSLEMLCDVAQAKADTNLMVKDQKGNIRKDKKGIPQYILNFDQLKICPIVGKMRRGDLVSLRGSAWPKHSTPYETALLREVRFIDMNTGSMIARDAGFYGRNNTGNGVFTTYFFVPRFDQFKPGSYLLELLVNKTECASPSGRKCALRKFTEYFPVEVLPDPIADQQKKSEKNDEQPKQEKPQPITQKLDVPKDMQKPIVPIKVYNPSLKLPNVITQSQDLELIIENAPPGSKVNRVYFGSVSSREQYVDIPTATAGNDGKIVFHVTVPSSADLAADPPSATFYWQEGVLGSITVTPAMNDSTGLSFWQFSDSTYFRGKETKIPLQCSIHYNPSITIGNNATYDQRKPFPEIVFSAWGFTCYDSLTTVISGIRTKGKLISSVHTYNRPNDNDFFRYGSGIFTTDRVGRTPWNYSLSGAPLMDPDVTQITLTVSDRHGRSASVPVNVIHPLHDYEIVVKNSDSDSSDGVDLNWRGFKAQPKSQLTLENEKLLKNPVLLGSFYLDAHFKDEEGKSVITFRVPESVPLGDYILRMKQGNIYATTLYSIKRRKILEPKLDTKKEQLKSEIKKTLQPCIGLTGYMLRQCKQTYDILDETKEERKQEEKINKNICAGLKGYILQSCKESYGLLGEKEQERKDPELPKMTKEPSLDIPCQGLSGYMLRSCQATYGYGAPEEEQPNERAIQKNQSSVCVDLTGYMLRSCEAAYGIKTPEQKKTPQSVTDQDQKKQTIQPSKDVPVFVGPDQLKKTPQQEIPKKEESSPVHIDEPPPECSAGSTYSATFKKCFENTPPIQEEPRPTCPEGKSYSVTLKQCVR